METRVFSGKTSVSLTHPHFSLFHSFFRRINSNIVGCTLLVIRITSATIYIVVNKNVFDGILNCKKVTRINRRYEIKLRDADFIRLTRKVA